MITKELLKSLGFNKEETIPNEESYVRRLKSHGDYAELRFSSKDKSKVEHLYVYSEAPDHSNIRKVVLSDTTVTKSDLMTALTLCQQL